MHQLDLFPLAEYRAFCAVDCESTGLGAQAQPIEIAAVRFVNGEPVARFKRRCRPSVSIDPDAAAVHFIREEDLVAEPHADSVLAELRAFVGDDMIVAHNGYFDRRFLHGLEENSWACSLRMARLIWPHAPSHRLANLFMWLGIHSPHAHGMRAHCASHDALMAGLVFEAGLSTYISDHPQATQSDLLAYLDRYPVVRFAFGHEHRGELLTEIPTSYLEFVLEDASRVGDRRALHVDPHTLNAVRDELELGRLVP